MATTELHRIARSRRTEAALATLLFTGLGVWVLTASILGHADMAPVVGHVFVWMVIVGGGLHAALTWMRLAPGSLDVEGLRERLVAQAQRTADRRREFIVVSIAASVFCPYLFWLTVRRSPTGALLDGLARNCPLLLPPLLLWWHVLRTIPMARRRLDRLSSQAPDPSAQS